MYNAIPFIVLLLVVSSACEEPSIHPSETAVEKTVTPPSPTKSESKSAYQPSPGEVTSISLVDLEKAGKFKTMDVVEATANDPAYKIEGKFTGYRLDDVLQLIPGYSDLDWTTHELRMIASDGYTVAVPRDKLTPGKGVLAFTHDSAPKNEKWNSFLQGKRRITPAPFYLVWDGIPYGPSHPWPYQLERIAIVNLDRAFTDAYPKHAPEVADGFAIYKARCLSCHSVNLIGGELGPEMNVPRNVTTYRSKEHLAGFIRNASDYRARTTMPEFADLTDPDIDKILAYLSAMDAVRVCRTADECKTLSP